jgi:hypothetical protein
MMHNVPKHMFLFGAGASHYSGPCSPSNPPLGNDLFRDLEEHLRCRPFINDEVLQIFEVDGFEAGFDALWRSVPHCIQSFQQDLSRYFLAFTPQPGNHYISFLEILRNKKIKVAFSSINYDLLLERAILATGNTYNHCVNRNQRGGLLVLKLHGSCNIVPVSTAKLSDFIIVEEVPQNEYEGSSLETYVSETLNDDQIIQFLDNESVLVPLIATYHKSKKVVQNPRTIELVQQVWKGHLEQVDALFIIGTRLVLHDSHIWDVVAALKKTVYWVSPDKSALEWARSQGVNMVDYCDTFEEFVGKYNSDF